MKNFLFLFFATALFCQDRFTVATWNLLNYPGRVPISREADYRIVLSEMNPDLLGVQEIDGVQGAQRFLDHVLNYSVRTYSRSSYVDGPDSDNILYFRDSLFSYLDHSPIRTALRNISHFRLVYRNSGDTLHVFCVHLKSSESFAWARASEIDSLVQVTEKLPAGSEYLVLGDFNIYKDWEPGYQNLVADSLPGRFVDVMPAGKWHDNPAFAFLHTQSPRNRRFGGGAYGGMDDRFDMILFSPSFFDSSGFRVIDSSYAAFGNDGFHFNDSINASPNMTVSDRVADALHSASDHLPVLVEIERMSSIAGVDDNGSGAPIGFEVIQNYPNPFNSETVIEFVLPVAGPVEISVFNVLGGEIVRVERFLAAGKHRYQFFARNIPTGIYFYKIRAGEFDRVRKMVHIK